MNLRDISSLVGVIFKHIDRIQTSFLEELIWRLYALQWLLLFCHKLLRSLMFLSKGVHVFVFTRLPSLRFIFNLLLPHFNLLISSDFLIFLFLYLASLDNVFGCNQLNWPWHFKLCSIAPELSHFPFMLSCWCSLFLVITFLFHLCTLRYNHSLMRKRPGNI